MSHLSYHWITSLEEFRELAPAWDEAVRASGEDNPFLLSPFLLTWWTYYGSTRRFRAFVVRDNQQLVGGLPLGLNRHGWCEVPGGHAANYTEWFALPAAEPFWQLFAEGAARRDDWQRISLRRCRRHRLADGALDAIRGQELGLLCDVAPNGVTYLFDVPHDAAPLLLSLPKKRRYDVRRSLQALAAQGRVELRLARTAQEAAAWYDRMTDLSRAAFRQRGMRSAFESWRYRAFFRDVINGFYARGLLDANALWLDDRILAVHFGYSLTGNLNYVLTAYDVRYACCQPGHLLLYHLAELAVARGNACIDLYPGDHVYKRQWATRREEVVSVELWQHGYRSRVARSLLRGLRASPLVRRLDRAVRSSPQLLELSRRAKTFLTDG